VLFNCFISSFSRPGLMAISAVCIHASHIMFPKEKPEKRKQILNRAVRKDQKETE
jgi:hypothetical protein